MAVLAIGICYFAYVAIGFGSGRLLMYSIWALPYVFLPLGIIVKDRCEWLAALSFSISLVALVAFAIVMLYPI